MRLGDNSSYGRCLPPTIHRLQRVATRVVGGKHQTTGGRFFILLLISMVSMTRGGAQTVLKDLDWREDSSGLKYIIYKPGNTKCPNEKSRIVVTYTTILAEVIHTDSSGFRKISKTDTMVLGDMIRGFVLSVCKLGEGGDGFFCVPPKLAYGAREGNAYQNQTFYFYIRLIKVLD